MISKPLLKRLIDQHTDVDETDLPALTTFIAHVLKESDSLENAAEGLMFMSVQCQAFADYLQRRELSAGILDEMQIPSEQRSEDFIEGIVRGIALGEEIGQDAEQDGHAPDHHDHEHAHHYDNIIYAMPTECPVEHEPIESDLIPNFEQIRLRPPAQPPKANFYVFAELGPPISLGNVASKAMAIFPCSNIQQTQAYMHMCAHAGFFHNIEMHDHLLPLMPNIIYLLFDEHRLRDLERRFYEEN